MNLDSFAQQAFQALVPLREKSAKASQPQPRKRNVGTIARRGKTNSVVMPMLRHAGMRSGDKTKNKRTSQLQALPTTLATVAEDMNDEEMQDWDDSDDEKNMSMSLTLADVGASGDISQFDSVSNYSGDGASSSNGKSRQGSVPASMLNSRATSRAASRPGGGIGDRVEKLVDPDRPLPFKPFCHKCSPLRPTDCLCLRPETLGKPKAHTQSVAAVVGTVVLARKSLASRASMARGNKDGPRKWAMILENLKFEGEVQTSSFEGCRADDDERPHCLCTDPKLPPVMHKFTPFEISLIKCWAIQHVKKQYLDLCVIAHAEAPAEKNRHRENMHSSTICQLVRKASKNQLDEVESAFMIARLRHYPLLRDLPKGMLEECANSLDVRTYGRGGVVFNRGDPIDGIYVLVQGDAEFIEGDVDLLGADSNVKSAPSVILLDDAIQRGVGRPFLLKPADQRVRSRGMRAWDSDEASTNAMFLWLPFPVIVKAAHFWRKREAHDRIDLIVKQFAPALRLDKGLCEKHCAIFDLEVFKKNHAILQQGSKPTMELARLGMIIEGEVRLMQHEKGHSGSKKLKATTPSAKDIIGPGKILGESALYGEPFPHYAFVLSDSIKILSLRVADFFEKLYFDKPFPLDKPLICSGTILHKTDDNRVAESEVREAEAMQKDGVQESASKLTSLICSSQHAFRLAQDNTAMKTEEWRRCGDRKMLKWRQPPDCRPHKSISATSREDTSYFAPIDLNYPREFDLFPSAQRSVLAARKSSPVSSRSATTTLPSSREMSSMVSDGTDDWMFASIDEKIKKKLVDAEELEAEHFLHTMLGVYMEDADRACSARPTTVPSCSTAGHTSSSFASRPRTTPGSQRRPGRNAVLLTCGAMATPPRLTPR